MGMMEPKRDMSWYANGLAYGLVDWALKFCELLLVIGSAFFAFKYLGGYALAIIIIFVALWRLKSDIAKIQNGDVPDGIDPFEPHRDEPNSKRDQGL